jgi:hypothetical protein
MIHRHIWVPGAGGPWPGARCRVCHKHRHFPTWRYRFFRLRYVDHVGFDDWSYGITLYRTGNYQALRPQLGVMFGHREAIFDLPLRVARWLPARPEE